MYLKTKLTLLTHLLTQHQTHALKPLHVDVPQNIPKTEEQKLQKDGLSGSPNKVSGIVGLMGKQNEIMPKPDNFALPQSVVPVEPASEELGSKLTLQPQIAQIVCETHQIECETPQIGPKPYVLEGEQNFPATPVKQTPEQLLLNSPNLRKRKRVREDENNAEIEQLDLTMSENQPKQENQEEEPLVRGLTRSQANIKKQEVKKYFQTGTHLYCSTKNKSKPRFCTGVYRTILIAQQKSRSQAQDLPGHVSIRVQPSALQVQKVVEGQLESVDGLDSLTQTQFDLEEPTTFCFRIPSDMSIGDAKLIDDKIRAEIGEEKFNQANFVEKIEFLNKSSVNGFSCSKFESKSEWCEKPCCAVIRPKKCRSGSPKSSPKSKGSNSKNVKRKREKYEVNEFFTNSDSTEEFYDPEVVAQFHNTEEKVNDFKNENLDTDARLQRISDRPSKRIKFVDEEQQEDDSEEWTPFEGPSSKISKQNLNLVDDQDEGDDTTGAGSVPESLQEVEKVDNGEKQTNLQVIPPMSKPDKETELNMQILQEFETFSEKLKQDPNIQDELETIEQDKERFQDISTDPQIEHGFNHWVNYNNDNDKHFMPKDEKRKYTRVLEDAVKFPSTLKSPLKRVQGCGDLHSLAEHESEDEDIDISGLQYMFVDIDDNRNEDHVVTEKDVLIHSLPLSYENGVPERFLYDQFSSDEEDLYVSDFSVHDLGDEVSLEWLEKIEKGEENEDEPTQRNEENKAEKSGNVAKVQEPEYVFKLSDEERAFLKKVRESQKNEFVVNKKSEGEKIPLNTHPKSLQKPRLPDVVQIDETKLPRISSPPQSTSTGCSQSFNLDNHSPVLQGLPQGANFSEEDQSKKHFSIFDQSEEDFDLTQNSGRRKRRAACVAKSKFQSGDFDLTGTDCLPSEVDHHDDQPKLKHSKRNEQGKFVSAKGKSNNEVEDSLYYKPSGKSTKSKVRKSFIDDDELEVIEELSSFKKRKNSSKNFQVTNTSEPHPDTLSFYEACKHLGAQEELSEIENIQMLREIRVKDSDKYVSPGREQRFKNVKGKITGFKLRDRRQQRANTVPRWYAYVKLRDGRDWFADVNFLERVDGGEFGKKKSTNSKQSKITPVEIVEENLEHCSEINVENHFDGLDESQREAEETQQNESDTKISQNNLLNKLNLASEDGHIQADHVEDRFLQGLRGQEIGVEA